MDQAGSKEKFWKSEFWKKYSSYLFFVFLISATAIVILTQVDPETFIRTIKQANGYFLILGIGCVFGYWILEAYMLLKLMRRDNPSETFHFAWTVTMIGQYYNLITPSATGDSPFNSMKCPERIMALVRVRQCWYKNMHCIK